MEENTALQAGVLLSLVETVGDYGAATQNPVLTAVGYNALAFTLYQSLKTNSLILTNSYWDATSNIATTLVGLLIGERPSARQWIGVLTISAGILILHWGD